MDSILKDPKAKKILALFAKLEVIKPVSFRNYTTLFVMAFIYLLTVGLGLYIFFSLHEDPYTYGVFCPILLTLFLSFYILFFLCMFKFKSYKDEINRILD